MDCPCDTVLTVEIFRLFFKTFIPLAAVVCGLPHALQCEHELFLLSRKDVLKTHYGRSSFGLPTLISSGLKHRQADDYELRVYMSTFLPPASLITHPPIGHANKHAHNLLQIHWHTPEIIVKSVLPCHTWCATGLKQAQKFPQEG